MDEIMLKIDNVSKKYKLGQIGGTTLRDELQRKKAKLLNEEDPTKQIGSRDYKDGEEFFALDGVSFEVKKGERVGIIGHNGAGKSTLLKLISRVTAPTSGTISMNGKVASMLEVGTGFHSELTGRENIYMNGAILGMTKKEIDSKIEDIIEFSECRQFIDTPVKRYSSGMYVKLAFSVAAHLDSEIMIMDEVLAVGDVAFQKKCLDKMKDISKQYGRTILYVSHNMSTIRQLCNKCVVLNKGKIEYIGNVEKAIEYYMNNNHIKLLTKFNFKNFIRGNENIGKIFKVTEVEILNKMTPVFTNFEKIILQIKWESKDAFPIRFGLSIKNNDGSALGLAESTDIINTNYGKTYITVIEFDLSNIAPGSYFLYVEPYILKDDYRSHTVDETDKIAFEIIESSDINHRVWFNEYWGNIRLNNVSIINNKELL